MRGNQPHMELSTVDPLEEASPSPGDTKPVIPLPRPSCISMNLRILLCFLFALAITLVLVVAFIVIIRSSSSPSPSTPTAAGHGPHSSPLSRPRNVIFMISDGCGPSSFTAARDYKNRDVVASSKRRWISPALSVDAKLVGSSRTSSYDSFITDSAAGATAYASALKTNNYMIGMDADGKPVGSLLEAARAKGMPVGIVVVSRVTDATPAAFGTHVKSRDEEDSIALQFASNPPDILLGGGLSRFTPSGRSDRRDLVSEMQSRGATVITNSTQLSAISHVLNSKKGVVTGPLIGLFAAMDMLWEIDRKFLENSAPSNASSLQPSLSEMVSVALRFLQQEVKRRGASGFFLMVEGSNIDKAAHNNDPAAHIIDVLEYDNTASLLFNFSDVDGHSLILSSSDHSTGGLTIGRGYDPMDPLRTREFTGSMSYPYVWYPKVLAAVKKSAKLMLQHSGVLNLPFPSSPITCADPIVAALVAEVQRSTGLNLTAAECGIIASAFSMKDNWSRMVIAAIGNVISGRAMVGWTTLSHTGEDVNLYTYGVGSNHFKGSMENSQVGEMVSELLSLDLDAVSVDLQHKR